MLVLYFEGGYEPLSYLSDLQFAFIVPFMRFEAVRRLRVYMGIMLVHW